MDKSRRNFTQAVLALATAYPVYNLFAATLDTSGSPTSMIGNFRYIYQNSNYKSEFLQFLTNVFHLFPERELHALIDTVTTQHVSDQEIYKRLQHEIGGIKPFLSELSYALPALAKQKKIMAKQTAQLLNTNQIFNSYLEIGSTGRYLDALEEDLNLGNERYFISDRQPGYMPQDLVDRGQIFQAGQYIDMNAYQPELKVTIPVNTIDLVTVYIGFHHCPIPLRGEFISSIRDVMSPRGKLIVRDHDVYDEKMWRMVALAHDVFNMGTNESWQYNRDELRNFYSLSELNNLLEKCGFRTVGSRLLQKGDPTLNTLMLYEKI